MDRTSQRRIVDVARGLFLVRYGTAEDELNPPTVNVSVEPRSSRHVAFVLHPDHKDAVLWQPGSCVVVKAAQAGQLAVEVSPSSANGSVAATVQIEPLSQGQPALRSGAARGLETARPGIAELRILGHVAGLGDVLVGANEWLAGPAAPSRLEGLSIDWPGKPRDIELRYSVRLARPHTMSDRMMELGSFAGTRGRALPIVGVVIESSGPGSDRCVFSAEALFLGSPTLSVSGPRLALSGPTGREPMVGFRMRVTNLATQPRPASVPVRKAEPPRTEPGRVRVFRSRSNPEERIAAQR